jgi:hypothetical protein
MTALLPGPLSRGVVVAGGLGGVAAVVFELAVFTATAGVFVAADFVFGLGVEFGDGDASTLGIDGDEGEVGRGDVAVGSGDGVFDPDFHADLHRSVEGAVHHGFQDEQVAHVDGGDEVDVVHGGGDDVGAGVAISGHGSDEVDKVHEAAAEQVAEGVGVVGQDELGHLGLRFGDFADRQGVARKFHWIARFQVVPLWFSP